MSCAHAIVDVHCADASGDDVDRAPCDGVRSRRPTFTARYGRAGEHCFVAVSTLTYRIHKDRAILGTHPADSEFAFRNAFAFEVQELLAVASSPDARASGRTG